MALYSMARTMKKGVVEDTEYEMCASEIGSVDSRPYTQVSAVVVFGLLNLLQVR